MPSERRPRRRCAGPARSSAVPSAAHYVGYVEEDETPEMIMKKFEALERVMATAAGKVAAAGEGPPEAGAGSAAAAGAEPGGEAAEAGPAPDPGSAEARLVGVAGQELTEEQLQEVFKQTSIFNVRSAMANNEVLMDPANGEADEDGWIEEEEEEEGLWEEARGFWSDAEEDLGGEAGAASDGEEGGPRGRARRAPRGTGGGPRGAGRGAQHSVVTHYNTVTQALIRRRVRVPDRNAVCQVRVPAPLPLSWGRCVKPYVPRQERDKLRETPEGDENISDNGQEPKAPAQLPPEQQSRSLSVPDLLRADKDLRHFHGKMQAVLVREGWERGCEGDSRAAAARLAKLPIPKLCPEGFVFIWARKQLIADMVDQLYRWGYQYVENLTWVLLAPNNTILTLPSPVLQTSHQTLFVFRKEGEGRDIELRHQRNPDVVFDCPCFSSGKSSAMPAEAWVAIETLLPTGKGRFLELWADPAHQRPGWAHVVEAPKGVTALGVAAS